MPTKKNEKLLCYRIPLEVLQLFLKIDYIVRDLYMRIIKAHYY